MTSLISLPIGGSICGAFVVFGGLSVILYKPWRRWVDEKRRAVQEDLLPVNDGEQG